LFKNAEESVVQFCLDKLSDLCGQRVTLQNRYSVGGGCINHALLLTCNTGNFFLKWNSSSPGDMFLKEAAGLQEMYSVDNPYLLVPHVIWAKEADELPGLLLMEYLQPSVGSPGDDEKLGRGLAVLHRKTAAKYGFYHDNYCGATVQDNEWSSSWTAFFGKQRIGHLVKLIASTRGLSSSDIALYEKLTDRLPGILSHTTRPSLIHGDLWSGNYMYTARGPALIDPAAYYADREMELSIMAMFGGFSSRVWSAYQEMFPLPDGWKERNRLYQICHFLNHYYLFGGSYLAGANRIAKDFL